MSQCLHEAMCFTLPCQVQSNHLWSHLRGFPTNSSVSSIHANAQVAWEDASREGSQRLGGEGKREALLARWLQEGNKRLRQRLAPGSLTRQSDPGPPTSGTSIPAHTKVPQPDTHHDPAGQA